MQRFYTVKWSIDGFNSMERRGTLRAAKHLALAALSMGAESADIQCYRMLDSYYGQDLSALSRFEYVKVGAGQRWEAA